ncbi:MAG TPA: glutamate formimidoyltransferase, partial [Pyrinomonadaceae bacterium]|nr:glutamate formimidoyltransferase [Pyrinomonadaceae bacterium]
RDLRLPIADCRFTIFLSSLLQETNLSPTHPIANPQSPIGNLVECVPNFSEGRNKETIARLSEAIASVETACVLDTHIDPDHNRSVITFVAHPSQVVTAAVKAVALAAELIDMRRHTGVHPRLGATDVLPFVPVAGITLDECAALAHRAGERIARELSIPVFYYEQAALRPERKNLEDVRRGALELLREQIATVPERAPDVGPSRVHETAGAIAVGARPFLIAFNINLRTNDVEIARQIARAVRARQGGLPFVKALGFELATRGLVQVSMNLVNYEVTGMEAAYAAVKSEAERLGVEIANTEIVGLVPEKALDTKAEYFSKLENFEGDKVLENRIEQLCRGTRE